MSRIWLVLVASLLWVNFAVAQIPIKGGCTVGASQQAHGISAAEAQERIKNYARRYVESYSTYKRYERDSRRKAYSYMELDHWTQDEVIGFTRDQRELLYISVGSELAQGMIDGSEIPGYVNAVEKKVFELEMELGCEMPEQP